MTVRKIGGATIEKVEELTGDDAASYEITACEVRLVIRDDLVTADWRQVLAELLDDLLSHYRLVEPLRLVKS